MGSERPARPVKLLLVMCKVRWRCMVMFSDKRG